MKTSAASASLLVLFAAAALAEQPAAPRFGEVATIVAVEVPVQVILKGQPVRGLKRENFEVYEGPNLQRLTDFEVVDVLAPSPPAAPAPPATIVGRRHFLLLFDLLNSEPSALAQARQATLKMVESLAPSDLVAVATYTRDRGVHLLLGFTPDRRQVRAALAQLAAPQLYDRNVDPLALLVSDSAAPVTMEVNPRTFRESAKADAVEVQRDAARETARLDEQANREQAVADAAALTRSFADLAHMMAAVGGRKYVVYLSEGFDGSLLTGRLPEEVKGEAVKGEEGREFKQSWEIDWDKTFGSGKAKNDLQRMLEEFRRTDCVIQAVDIGRLRAGADLRPRASGTDTLVLMAKDTGGEMYQNFNDLGAAMGQMLVRTSVTYVLTYQPAGLELDGRYRKISVKLRDAPRGAEIAYRPGYYAPRPFARQSELERRLRLADLVVGAEEKGSIDAAVLVAPLRGEADRAWVALFVEADGETLLQGENGDQAAVECYAYAFDERGEIAGRWVQSLGLDLAKLRSQLAEGGLKLFGHLELGPGRYSVRVVVRNGRTGAIAARVVALELPATRGPAATLLPPLFPDGPGRWLMVREPAKVGEASAPYPFMLRQTAFVPAARPRLVADRDVPLILMAYDLGEGPLVASAELAAEDGKTVAGGRLTIGERVAVSDGPERIVGSFRADRVPPGRYLLRVRIQAGDRQAVVSPAIAVDVYPSPAAPAGS